MVRNDRRDIIRTKQSIQVVLLFQTGDFVGFSGMGNISVGVRVGLNEGLIVGARVGLKVGERAKLYKLCEHHSGSTAFQT
jgi:hypothetical protein